MRGVQVVTERSKKRVICKKFAEGFCPNRNCADAHGVEDLQVFKQLSLDEYKKQDCKAFKDGFCGMGEACFDKHDESSDNGCPLYHKTLRCYFPHNCPLENHPGAKKAVGFFPRRALPWRMTSPR